MQREEENEDVVWERLQVSVQGVESVRCEGGGDWCDCQLASKCEIRLQSDVLSHLWWGLCNHL